MTCSEASITINGAAIPFTPKVCSCPNGNYRKLFLLSKLLHNLKLSYFSNIKSIRAAPLRWVTRVPIAMQQVAVIVRVPHVAVFQLQLQQWPTPSRLACRQWCHRDRQGRTDFNLYLAYSLRQFYFLKGVYI
jgi:hypothetical protein